MGTAVYRVLLIGWMTMCSCAVSVDWEMVRLRREKTRIKSDIQRSERLRKIAGEDCPNGSCSLTCATACTQQELERIGLAKAVLVGHPDACLAIHTAAERSSLRDLSETCSRSVLACPRVCQEVERRRIDDDSSLYLKQLRDVEYSMRLRDAQRKRARLSPPGTLRR